MEPVVFKRWSNKGWAVMASLHKVIIIGTLCFSYQMVAQDQGSHPNDSSQAEFMLELEEVEATEALPAELEAVSLKPMLLVTSQDISEAAATSHEEVLEYLPQVDIRQRGRHGIQSDLSIQGGSFDQSMVLLNGINLSDPQTGHLQLNLPVDLQSISQIEVVTGSAARRFGTNAFAGAVNVVTRPADSTFINATLRYGQHGLYGANLKSNLGGKQLNTLISLNTAGSRGYRENTDFRTTHLYLHTTAGKGRLKTHLMAGLSARAFGANAFYSPRFVHQYEATTTGLAALKMELKETRSRWTLNAYYKLNRDHFLLDRHNPAFYSNDHLTRVTGGDLEGKVSTEAGITRTGLHYRGEQIRSTSLGEPLDVTEPAPFSDSVTFSNGHLRNQFNWNLDHTWQQGLITLSGGLMVHMNSDLGFRPALFPGVDIRLQLPESFRIYASANRSMRLPTFTDLYYQGPDNVGNPQLIPEKATTFELGAYRNSGGLHMGLNGFYRQGKELIDWVLMDDQMWHTMNLTRVDAAGGNLSVQYHSPGRSSGTHTPQMDHSSNRAIYLERAEASYTFTHLTKVSQQVTSRYVLDNLRHKVVAGASLRLVRNLLLTVKVTGQDRNGTYMAYDAATGLSEEQPFDPFVLADLKLDYGFGRFHIFAEATNLLNVEYNDIGNVIQPGRWTLVGLAIR
ncbi:MAG: TonB-dependent receptor [Bacteroidota bacterium]